MKQYWQIYALVLALALSSCKKAPEFPIVPEIRYERTDIETIVENRGPNNTKKLDSLTIVLKFKDGDGDLGTSNGSFVNYYCRLLLKLEGQFKPLIDSSFNEVNKNGTFLPLSPDNRQGPLEGELYYRPALSGLALTGGLKDSTKITLKFEVYIKDNAGHSSNTVQTEEKIYQFYD